MGKIITALIFLNLVLANGWAQNQDFTYALQAETGKNNASDRHDSSLQSQKAELVQNREAPSRQNTPESQGKTTSDSTGGFRIMIIGSGAPAYNPDRSGPSALVRYGNRNFLVDMGNGTQARLNEAGIKIRQLNGLFFTHHHLDHNEEFVPLFTRVLLGGRPFLVTGPKKTKAYVQAILSLYEEDIAYRLNRRNRTFDEIKDNWETKELQGSERFSYQGITISTAKVNHTIYTIAYRFDADGKSIVISGDLSYSPSLPELAKNADVLVIESGGVIKKGDGNRRGRPKRRRPQGGGQANQKPIRAHSNLDEIARMAKDADVKKLVLTHFTPGEVDEIATKEAISKQFQGEVIFGRDLMEVRP